MKDESLSDKKKEFEKDTEVRYSQFIGRLNENGKEQEIIFVYPEKDAKKHIQNAQRRLKDKFEEQKESCKKVWHRNIAFQYLTTLELLEEDINKIFLEEFGEKILKK